MLRVEDHDRQRSRAQYEAALLDDLERLGLLPNEPSPAELRAGASSWRQSDCGALYEEALGRLREAGLVYECHCARSVFTAWQVERGRAWSGPGCPGGCREHPGRGEGPAGLRVAVGEGSEGWRDLLAGPARGEPAASGDLLVRDRLGNWTYSFCVVVDDMRHGVDLVIRGRDLLDATPVQLRLAHLLGRPRPPRFLHHPLLRLPSGRKLSKAEGDTSVRSLLEAGWSGPGLLGHVAHVVGLVPHEGPVEPDRLGSLFA